VGRRRQREGHAAGGLNVDPAGMSKMCSCASS
jgi:hypothetical protein